MNSYSHLLHQLERIHHAKATTSSVADTNRRSLRVSALLTWVSWAVTVAAASLMLLATVVMLAYYGSYWRIWG